MTEAQQPTTCPRHPKVVTNLRCASCGTLICPRCLVQTPVGAKCPGCASAAASPLFRPSVGQAVLAGIVALAAGAVAGWAVQFELGFITLFLALVYGGFAGEMILRASGRKRGLKMELITGICMAAGAISGRLIVAAVMLSSPAATRPPHGVLDILVRLVAYGPIPLVALAIAVFAAISRIRYL